MGTPASMPSPSPVASGPVDQIPTTLTPELRARLASQVQRESKLKREVEDLKQHLARASVSRTRSETLGELYDMNRAIQMGIQEIQGRCSRIAKEHERELMRNFRERLREVEKDLEAERQKQPEQDAAHWIQKYKKIERQNEWLQSEAFRLERLNSTLAAELNRLKQEYKQQQEDREHLIQQIVQGKKEQNRLKAELSTRPLTSPAGMGMGMSTAPPSEAGGERERARPLTTAGENRRHLCQQLQRSFGMAPVRATRNQSDTEKKLRDHIKRLRELLEIERKNLRAVRRAHVKALAERTELQILLRQCVADVKQEIAVRRAERASHPSQMGEIAVSDFQMEDRQRLLELLLSQERVISLLYEKTFPNDRQGAEISPPATRARASRGGPRYISEEDAFREAFEMERKMLLSEMELDQPNGPGTPARSYDSPFGGEDTLNQNSARAPRPPHSAS